MTITDNEAAPCTSSVLTDSGFVRCGSTTRRYTVGGRTAVTFCANWKRCGFTRNLDVTIDHAKHRWTLAEIRDWWVKVYG